MIVAMRAMRVMEVPFHQIVRMIPVRHGFMSAAGPVDMVGLVRAALVVWRAAVLMRFVRCQFVFVNVVSVDMVQMTIVKIVGVAVVLHGLMPAVRAVDMSVPFMFRAGFRHLVVLLSKTSLLSQLRQMKVPTTRSRRRRTVEVV